MASAIEVYNKPSVVYREETFSLLALNAWELLLKAKILRDGGNDPKWIRVHETRRTKSGKPSKKLYLKRNRAGTPLTMSLHECMTALDADTTTRLAPEMKANLYALIAIRDHAAHYIHANEHVSKQVLEVGVATIRNFVNVAKKWFQRDFSKSLSPVLPLAFLSGNARPDAIVTTEDESSLIEYLRVLGDQANTNSPYAVAVRMEVKFERSKLATAAKVQVTKDSTATKIALTEPEFRAKWPWDYKTLGEKCKHRYTDFKFDRKFHDLRKPLLGDPRYAYARYLDPNNPKSGRKDFYSSAILNVFDKQYTLKKP